MRILTVLALAALLGGTAFAQPLAVSPGAERAALNHVRAKAGTLGLAAGDVADLAVSSAHVSARSGLSLVYVQQRVGGIDVAEQVVTVAVGRDGAVVHAAGDLVAGTASASKAASLSPEAALQRAAAHVGATVPAIRRASSEVGAERKTSFGRVNGFDASARLVYAGTKEAGLRLAWEVVLPTRAPDHLWLVRVDAQTGAELSRGDLIVHDTFGPASGDAKVSYIPLARGAAARGLAPSGVPSGVRSLAGSYNVYPFPYESPNHTSPTPPADGRTTVSGAEDPRRRPSAGTTRTASLAPSSPSRAGITTNIRRSTTTTAPDPNGQPDGGAGLVFDFPLDLTMSPEDTPTPRWSTCSTGATSSTT